MKVTFTKKHRPYNVGETASFDERQATRLIGMGVAVAVADKAPKQPSEPKEPITSERTYETATVSSYETPTMTPRRRGRGRPKKTD